MDRLKKIKAFLQNDAWKIRAESLPRKQYIFLRLFRIFSLSARLFNEHNCALRSAALTFYALLSIVPVAAMAFGVAKGFGLELALERQLIAKFPIQKEALVHIFAFANNLLFRTRGDLIAGIGVALLFWSVVNVFSNIERSFNDIWRVKRGRSLERKFSDYLSAMVVCPLLFIIASGINIFIQARFVLLLSRLSFLGAALLPLMLLLKMLPFVVMWLLFGFIYIFMPNTKVELKSAAFAAIIAGTAYQITQIIYIAFQIGVSSYNAIYGSFAALPLFLVWLQLSWNIVLFGAEISFAHQNVEAYELERESLGISRSYKKLLLLAVMHMIVKRFQSGARPVSANDVIKTFNMPVRLAHDILFELAEAGLASESRREQDDVLYQPAMDINAISIRSVLETIEKKGSDNIDILQTGPLLAIGDCLKRLDDIVSKAPENRLLKDIDNSSGKTVK